MPLSHHSQQIPFCSLLRKLLLSWLFAVTTFYTTALSQREILYDVRYSSAGHLLETEYVVLDPSSKSDYKNYHTAGKEDGFINLTSLLEKEGYQRLLEKADTLVIFQKE